MSEIEYQNYISDFFSQNNQEIEQICKKTTKNTEYEWQDLYAESYIYLIDNKDKIGGLVELTDKDRPLMRFIAQWVYNNIRLYSANSGQSNFKAKYRSINEELNKQIKKEDLTEFNTINDTIQKIIVQKDEQIDLSRLHKLQKIDNIIEKLDEIDKKLYNMFYHEDLNFVQISKRLNISLYMTKNLINQMKDNITNLAKIEFND